MSRFSGPQYKGAAKALKALKREEADKRNAEYRKRKEAEKE